MDLVELFRMSANYDQYEAGDVVFSEGDPGDYMYVIMEGAVGIQGTAGTISTYRAGDFFGEMALIDASPRSARAVAAEPSRLMPVDEGLFKYLVAENPEFSLHVMRVLVDRLRRADPRLWRGIS